MPRLPRIPALGVFAPAALFALAALPNSPAALWVGLGLAALNLHVLRERRKPLPQGPPPGSGSDSSKFLMKGTLITGEAEGPGGFLLPGGYDVEDRRDYEAGDDPKYIDWKATARTGKLITKLSAPPTGAVLWVFVDASASCGGAKWALFVQLCRSLLRATELGYQTAAIILCGGETGIDIGPGRGRNFAEQALAKLQGSGPASAAPGFARAMARYTDRLSTSAVVLVLSDFHTWTKEDVQAVQRLQKKGAAVAAIKVSAPEEWELPFLEEVSVSNPETGESHRVDLSDPVVRTEYRYTVHQWHEKTHAALESLMPVVECSTGDAGQAGAALAKLKQLLREKAGR